MLVRLTILRPHPRSLRPQGLFAPAYALRRERRCPPGFERWLDQTLNWLDAHLLAPDIDEPRAIFWLRDEWQIVVERMWALAVILREAGERVRMVKTTLPGYVVYEDAVQVAAVPYRNTFTRR